MFVFPAFDSNYKTRKRTFRCCSQCRLKRIKCDLSSSKYETEGCLNCKKNALECDLIPAKTPASPSSQGTISPKNSTGADVAPKPPTELNPVEPFATPRLPLSDVRQQADPKLQANATNANEALENAILFPLGTHSPTLNQGSTVTSSFSRGHESVSLPQDQKPKDPADSYDPPRVYEAMRGFDLASNEHRSTTSGSPPDETVITAQYMSEKFNFNISGPDSESTYQYVIHDHPKVIIAQASKPDQRIWHESGVYVDIDADKNVNSKRPYKVKNFGKEGTDKVYQIKSMKLFRYLESIYAFTLRTPRFLIERNDVKEFVELYFRKVNVIFPILLEDRFWSDFDDDKAHSLVVFAMVLMISRDKMAQPILKRVFMRSRPYGTPEFTEAEYDEEFVDWMQDLEHKIRQCLVIIPELGDNDKLSRLIISLLLSFHFDFGKLGNEKSSQDVTNALNYAVSLGIHMKNINPNRTQEQVDYLNNLWWVCYFVDRVNALTNSRCIFLHKSDFNINLPYDHVHLLKMVHLATSLEQMMISIYQPFNNTHTSFNDNPTLREITFKAQDFQENEFKICDEEIASSKVIFESSKGATKLADLRNPFNKYATNTIHFFTRLVSNAIILSAQKAKYDNPEIDNSIPDSIALKASSNMFFYVSQMKEDWLVNIPLLSWCVSLGMSVVLKKYAREVLSERASINCSISYMWNDYMTLLEKFAPKWWVVDEICKLSRDFVDKLREIQEERGTAVQADSMNQVDNLFAGNPENESKYDGYIQTMNIDLFDMDFFRGMPSVINFISEI